METVDVMWSYINYNYLYKLKYGLNNPSTWCIVDSVKNRLAVFV